MKRTLWLTHLVAVLCLVLLSSCSTSRATLEGEMHPREEPKTVGVSELPGGALRLTFESVAPDPGLEQLRVEEARALLAAFHESFSREEGRRVRLVRTSTGQQQQPEEWEQRLREEFVARYGAPEVPLPGSLETSPVFLALKLSPRYMGAGVREAAREMFRSPVFLSSVALSVLLYFSAWLMPEPILSKAFVTALTLRLALLVGVLELNQFARACARLYQEARAARTLDELEAVAERFGRAVGGTGLRVLVMVASMGVAKGLPQVPRGGLGALLGGPRFALPGGLSMGGATTVQMVADGTVVVTGVAAGTAASVVGSACTDGSEIKEGHQWHHLATNKNDTSTVTGGPWTPLFKRLFAKAGMSLDAAENLVYLKGHRGPHPEEYHEAVYDKLRVALEDCETVSQCKSRLIEALKMIANETCTPGSRLHRLVTRPQD